jgi:hypothetical protein
MVLKVKVFLNHKRGYTNNQCKEITFCRHFQDADILPVACVYVMELTGHVKLNVKTLEQNNEIHIHSSCQKSNVHDQLCRTNVAEKDVMNVGFRLFNCQVKLGKW